jgi:uncharacterized coiled-coil protein SlyX
MHRIVPTRMSFTLAAILSGCAAHGDIELLEKQLRLQEDTIQQLNHHLTEARTDLEVARGEAHVLRSQLHRRAESPAILPEQAETLYRVEGVRFNKLFTSGLDADGVPGDEALAVLIQPHDGDGELIKVPARIELQAVDLSQPPDSQLIGSWRFSAEESRQIWHRGFIGSGFLLHLPWQRPPLSTELTLHARITTPDGRAFNTTQQIKVHAPPAEFDTQQFNVQPAADQSIGTSQRWTDYDRPVIR